MSHVQLLKLNIDFHYKALHYSQFNQRFFDGYFGHFLIVKRLAREYMSEVVH